MIYSLLLATLCMGCGGRIGMRQLNELEACMNDAPDSVLAVLTTADMPRWGERRALYALLTVQAQDKSYIDVADDSLISVATDYYEHKGEPLRRLQAFYYHGRVYANAGRRHEAMAAYTRAKDFVDEVDAFYTVGLLYLQLGVLYGYDYDYSEALVNMEYSLKCFTEADKERLQYIAKRNIGQYYLNMNQFSEADSLLNEVLVWGEAHNDSSFMHSTLIPLLCLYDATANVDALGSIFMRYPIDALPQNAPIFGIVAHYHALKGNEIAAKNALAYAWDISTATEDSAMLLQKSYQIYKTLEAPYDALFMHEQLLAHQDSVVRITLQQPLIASQRDHYESRLKIEELRNLNYRYLMGIAALILLIVAALLYIYVRNRFRHKQEELDNYMELADELRHTLYHKEESIANNEVAMERIRQELQLSQSQLEELRVQLHVQDDAMQTQIADLLGGQFRLLNKLSETYYELEASRESTPIRNRIFEQVKGEIDSLRKDGKKLVELEAIVNLNLDNIMTRLRAELPHLKDKDFVYLTFFYARFSGKAISLFTRTKRDTVYKIKERLCAKIESSDAPSKDYFLSMLP